MSELFNELAIVGDAIEEEDRVVYLLASLPDSYNTLVTALETHEEFPKMEVATERLLHAERKQKEKSSLYSSGDKAMITRRHFKGRGPQCYYCRKYGHIQKKCIERIRAKEQRECETLKGNRSEANKVGLVTCHVL